MLSKYTQFSGNDGLYNSGKGGISMKNAADADICVFCGSELSLWEKTRCYCWHCGEMGAEAYDEETEDSLI
jgi:hypothetical protein